MSWIIKATDHITQGSIVYGIDWGMGESNPLSIVLSNACDLSHNKCSFLIVLALLPAQETLSSSKEFLSIVDSANAKKGLTSKSWKALCDFLKGYIHNKNICRYYFIDPSAEIDAPLLVADFQMIKSVEFNKIDQLENLAQLPPPFIEQLIIHFASYTARIPSDRVNEESETKLVEELACGYCKS